MENQINKQKSTSAQQDDKLIAEFKFGNEKSIVKLIDKYKDFIMYFFTKSFPNDKELCFDLTQDIIERVLLKINLFNGVEYSFSTWLATMIKNYTIDYVRSKEYRINKNRVYISASDSSEENESRVSTVYDIPFNELNPEQEMIRKERIKMIYSVMEKLKGVSRVLVYMKYVEDKTYEQIMNETNLKLSDVKTKLYQARIKMKPYLSSFVKSGKHNISY